MSQENVKVVQAAYEAWNAGATDVFRELYDPDVIVRSPEGWPEPGPFVAMSQENVELIHRASDAFNRRDLGAFLELLDDDVEFVPRAATMEGSHDGHDGVRRWWENVFGVWPDLTTQLVEVRDVGDLTVAAVHLLGHGAGSDTPLDETTWQVSRWRCGKSVWWRTFATRAEALEAVGLSEQDAHADS